MSLAGCIDFILCTSTFDPTNVDKPQHSKERSIEGVLVTKSIIIQIA